MKSYLSKLIVGYALVQQIVAASPNRVRGRGATQTWLGYNTKKASCPWPTELDVMPGCSRWIVALEGDDCRTLAGAEGVSVNDFIAWNPSLALNCNAVKTGHGYCVENPTYRASKPKCKCTTTVTASTTVTATKATLAPSQFPTASGTVQCVQTDSPIPEPTQIPSGGILDDAIARVCDQLVGPTNKWLAVGDPYIAVISVDGTQADFLLRIQLGGFPVENSLCKEQFGKIVGGCTADEKTYGGCSYSDDFNLGACILPRV
ncbi:hypothetical protein H072_10154 [Dactylellina haptotyla CBS 200.50]|uniref:LysM domain-containing protein n=1 Tax=Dactylellina haptotyla (strain CBS 200.50) TaxID=1284197 RepID=S8A016_DACHA|nr:hypothetical protein H072_10154 [Dactylellina haptotyla CBS 200.50]